MDRADRWIGDDVILSQISNESGTYGITISSRKFSIRDDVVLSAANMATHYIQSNQFLSLQSFFRILS